MTGVPESETVVGEGIRDIPPPWPVDNATLAARMDRIGMRPVDPDTLDPQRRYVHIDVVIGGKPVTVPADIGIGPGITAPIQTHDPSGVVTVIGEESYSLRALFAIWGVRFTANEIGDVCNEGGRVLRVFVDGRPNVGDLLNIPLVADEGNQEILVVYGTESELPSPLPSSYPFPD